MKKNDSIYLYWLTKESFEKARSELTRQAYTFSKTLLTPCQVLRTHGRKLIYATPEIWSGMCKRQGSWYRDSVKNGQYMLASASPLPEQYEKFLDAEMTTSAFQPESLPTRGELESVVHDAHYQERKPDAWEKVARKDSFIFKIFFTVIGIWKRGDTMKKHWLGHRANHANFLTKRFTTDIDGDTIPYSVTENAGVCSSCAEFFNVVDPDQRKLVRACPGSIAFGGAARDLYYDVKPK